MNLARVVTRQWRFWSVIVALIAVLGTAGCTTEDDEGDEPTPTAGASATSAADPTATSASTETAGAQTQINGQAISDGVCLAVIPDGWVDDGTGRGTTSDGGRFVLFGGRVLNDAAWQSAVNAVATPSAGRAVASDERTADMIHVVYADDRGFEYRKRFGNRYCDLSVTSSRPISAEAQAIWPAILETLEPTP
jgi:hypothetical protein